MIRGLIGAVVGLAVMVAAGYAAAVVYINNDGRRLAEIYFKPWGGRGKVTFGSVDKSMFEDTLTIGDITVRAPDGRSYKIKRIVVRDYDWLNLRRPRYADVTIDKAETTPEGLGPAYAPTVKAAGLDRLVASAHYRYRYNDATKRFVIETVRVEIDKVGVLTLSARFELDQYPDFERLRDPAQLMQLGGSFKLIGARASFRDRDLARHIVQAYAANRGVSADEARSELVEMIERDGRRKKDPIQREAFAAAASFIKMPGRIEAVVAPAAPVSVTSAAALLYMNPGELKRTLGLKIEAKPPESAAPGARPPR